MAFFMFIDESGQDQRESPYEVLAGVVVHDAQLWPLVQALHDAELRHFGCRYASMERELKAKRLLKTKVFRQAADSEPFEHEERRRLAEECLRAGAGKSPAQLAGLAQAKLAYCEEALAIAAAHGCRAFASIIPREAPRPADADVLRKDYSYLFERFFYFLDQHEPHELGIIVFDELERAQSHLLIDQMERYFMGTATGAQRRTRVIPEPFFVHSHLTTGVHLADLIAYVIAWGLRVPKMTAPAREELAPFATAAHALFQDIRLRKRRVWALNVISDLRPRIERGVPLIGGIWPRPPRRL